LKSPESRKKKAWIFLPRALNFLPQDLDFPSLGFENPSLNFGKVGPPGRVGDQKYRVPRQALLTVI
jgi:hypothetical protein